MFRYWIMGLLLSCATASWAEAQSLPSPLTLQAALAAADRLPVGVLRKQAELARLEAQRLAASLPNRLRLGVEAEVGQHELWGAGRHYHRLQLVGSKVLYDSGREAALKNALARVGQAVALERDWARAQYRLKVIEAFFNVLLADVRYRALNEEMAVVYVTLDRLRDRHALGTISDVALAKAEKDYTDLLARRNAAELAQRQRRLQLAILLGRSDAVIDEVRAPDLKPLLATPIEDVSKLLAQLPHRNPQLVALRQRLDGTAERMRWARLQKAPTVTLQAAAGPRYYESGVDKDSWDVRLRLDWPLLDGGVAHQAEAQVTARRIQLLSDYKARLQTLQNRLVTLWGRLVALPSRQKWLDAYQDYVDLNMELKRGLYENEERTDIGDAMIEQSRLDEAALKTLFEAALARYELNAMLGEKLP